MDRRRQTESRVPIFQGEYDEFSRPALMSSTEVDRQLRRRELGRKVSWRLICLMMVGVVSVISTVFSIVSIITLERSGHSLPTLGVRERLVSKIAFGSGTASDYSPQPVWVHGVIPSDPDAWIWLGDMAYMDEPRVNCKALPSHEQCNCTDDWLHQSPYSCMAGNVDHARSRVQVQLSNPDYAQFLAFMCPDHRAKGLFPPTGADPLICPRRLLGTYDDHDYSWSHGNKRLPHKDELKQIFLDAVGEPSWSARRNSGRGIEWKYTLNEGRPGQEIDVFLLDERYSRDTLPCYTRQHYCEEVLMSSQDHPQNAWCQDFLHGGDLELGSCCTKDEEIYFGWCKKEASKKSALYAEACDASSPLFGMSTFMFDPHGELRKTSSDAEESFESAFCEVLGRDQRLWLQEGLAQSEASLKVLVSSSVILGNPNPQACESGSSKTNLSCICTGDDWECYKPAQLQLLHLLSRAPGCLVILTGDFLFSDIKVWRPHTISEHYEGVKFPYPLFQVMASGLTASTSSNFSCDDKRRDPLGFRDHNECAFARAPSFGMLEMEWNGANSVLRLQIRDGKTGKTRLESILPLNSC